jgi:hypothetical protein
MAGGWTAGADGWMVGAGTDGRRARVAGRLAGDAGEDRRRRKGLDGRADVWLAAGGAGV